MEKIGRERLIKLYKENDLVYFDDGDKKGVGKIVAHSDYWPDYLVHSTQLSYGHPGLAARGQQQDNDSNWYFAERDLKPFVKQEGQKYKVLMDSSHNFKVGDIATLTNLYEDGVSSYKTEDKEWFLNDIDRPQCEVEFYADAPQPGLPPQSRLREETLNPPLYLNGKEVSSEVYEAIAGLIGLAEDRDGMSGTIHVELTQTKLTPGQSALSKAGYISYNEPSYEDWVKDDTVVRFQDNTVELFEDSEYGMTTLGTIDLDAINLRLKEITTGKK